MSDRIRVLLVDDDPSLLRAYHNALTRFGMAVETATSGRDAAGRVEPAAFDVILSDISMPEMTGLDLLAAVVVVAVALPYWALVGEPLRHGR